MAKHPGGYVAKGSGRNAVEGAVKSKILDKASLRSGKFATGPKVGRHHKRKRRNLK